ncbi:MAG: type I-D CRISPR-associated protein Cas10d/Csc3 [Chloroflexi bacterium]|nr:type I-D CRISPR-associated protein Cas10d/Csc3 [Chloroflexota bacterium]
MDDNDFLLPDESFTDLESKETGPAATLLEQPLFSTLLLSVIGNLWPGDRVMEEFVQFVAPRICDRLGGESAKGGDFSIEKTQAGSDVERYEADQSFRAHLINGLFPALNLARTLQSWQLPMFRAYDDITRRVFIAGYVLHDFLKLPGVDVQLEKHGFNYQRAVGMEQMPVLEDIFRVWCSELGLDDFLASLGGADVVLHDLIYVACNTQVRWGTLRNLQLLPRLTLSHAQLELAEQLSHFADLITYVARTPQEAATHSSINTTLAWLSNTQARLTVHHLSDNRGVLTNFIHNAALAAMSNFYRVPLLYAPSGVVYVEHKTLAGALPEVSQIAADTIERIRQAANESLKDNIKGFQFDNSKGMKYAPFLWLLFDLPTLLRKGVKATLNEFHFGKKSVASNRFNKIRENGWMAPGVDLDLPDDMYVDQLAEWCFLAERQVKEWIPSFDTGEFLLRQMGLEDLRGSFAAVPRDGRTGGIGYHWYYAAGHYVKRGHASGLDPATWAEQIERFADALASAVSQFPAETQPETLSDWGELQRYIEQTLHVGTGQTATCLASFQTELERYSKAKQRGRGRTQVCALCSSSFRIGKQREAAVLFAPQVYSNKRPLNTSDAIRDICAVCGLEMMLRQIFMKDSNDSGADYENRLVRYLYFYPTYFFTPETLGVLRSLYTVLRRPSLKDIREQLTEDGQLIVTNEVVQHLQLFMALPDQSEADPPETDHYPRLQFSKNEPMTFFFLGIPLARRPVKPRGEQAKITDVESWVYPALLALLLPLLLDVKVVASESSLPVLLEADELPETVFLDAPHASIQRLLKGQVRINIDHVLPALRRLLAAYLIHADANSRSRAGDFDYAWQSLPALTRDLDDSPLYVFYYLKKRQRKNNDINKKKNKMDSLPVSMIEQFMQYLKYLEGEPAMSHARELTKLYRRFYRAKRFNGNSILRPISIAADVILRSRPGLFPDEESLKEAIYGRLLNLKDLSKRESLSFFVINSRDSDEAMRQFAAYFVDEVFYKALHGDRSALRGKQLNLLKNACEAVYMEEVAHDRAEREQVELEEEFSEVE